ncbi:MAG: hypothetical protein GY817_00665 [bacterium]|nr:hypothetical protein [bacterium]
MEIKFLVQGSTINQYEVKFIKCSSNILNAYCNCPAAENRLYCKHRLNILSGITDKIISENLSDVEIVQNWLKGTILEFSLNEYKKSEDMINKQIKLLKKQLSNYKKNIAKAMLQEN